MSMLNTDVRLTTHQVAGVQRRLGPDMGSY